MTFAWQDWVLTGGIVTCVVPAAAVAIYGVAVAALPFAALAAVFSFFEGARSQGRREVALAALRSLDPDPSPSRRVGGPLGGH